MEYSLSSNGGWMVNKMATDAICHNLEVIGEAANKLGDGFRAAHPEIPSRGMRKHSEVFHAVHPKAQAIALGAKIEIVEKIVRIFNSFEEADAADALTRAQMTPQQRADIFFELRERANPDAFKQGLARVYRVLELEQS